MKNSFKKILLSAFIIGVSIFSSNNVFAENYKVNIAVLGNLQKGKTQIIRCMMGLPFQEKSIRSNWSHGAYGMQKTYLIDGDVFECSYYDAPGYLKKECADIDGQINSVAIENANIALIVVDPKQNVAESHSGAASSIDEALLRHAANVRKVNPKCKVIVVINKIDLVKSQEELSEYKEMLKGARLLYRGLETDGVFASAKDGTGIRELEGKITNLLKLNKASFERFDNSFIICKNDGKQQRMDRSVRGIGDNWYCSEGCLAQAEGEFCACRGCENRKLLLEVKGNCVKARYADSSGKRRLYCCEEHYILAEGQCCSHKGCNERFIVKDGRHVTSPGTGKKYCCEQHLKASEDGCTIL